MQGKKESTRSFGFGKSNSKSNKGETPNFTRVEDIPTTIEALTESNLFNAKLEDNANLGELPKLLGLAENTVIRSKKGKGSPTRLIVVNFKENKVFEVKKDKGNENEFIAVTSIIENNKIPHAKAIQQTLQSINSLLLKSKGYHSTPIAENISANLNSNNPSPSSVSRSTSFNELESADGAQSQTTLKSSENSSNQLNTSGMLYNDLSNIVDNTVYVTKCSLMNLNFKDNKTPSYQQIVDKLQSKNQLLDADTVIRSDDNLLSSAVLFFVEYNLKTVTKIEAPESRKKDLETLIAIIKDGKELEASKDTLKIINKLTVGERGARIVEHKQILKETNEARVQHFNSTNSLGTSSANDAGTETDTASDLPPEDLPPVFNPAQNADLPPADLPPVLPQTITVDNPLPQAIEYQESEEVTNLKAKLQEKEAELLRKNKELEEVQSLKGQIQELQATNLANEKTISEIQKEADTNEKEISSLKETIKKQISQIETLQSEIKSAKTTNQKLEENLSAAKDNLDQVNLRLQAEIEELKQKVEELEKVNSLKQTTIEANNRSARETQGQLKARISELESTNQLLQTQNEELKENGELQNAKGEIENKDREIQNLKQELPKKNTLSENQNTSKNSQSESDRLLSLHENSNIANTYKYSNRYHWYKTKLADKFANLTATYGNDTIIDDNLKRKILDVLKNRIIEERITNLETMERKYSSEVSVLKETQGVAYSFLSFFGKNTSSMNVLQKMLDDREEELKNEI